MTTRTVNISRQYCDVEGCENEVRHSQKLAGDKHICLKHRAMIDEDIMADLIELTSDILRESHEGGTQYLAGFERKFDAAWLKAMSQVAENSAQAG